MNPPLRWPSQHPTGRRAPAASRAPTVTTAAPLISHAVAGLALAVALICAPCVSSAQALSDQQLEAQRIRLEASDPEVRASAADTLGRRGASRRAQVVPLLRRALRSDADWRVRASSGRAIGRLAARDAVPDLVRALRDPRVDVRVVAAAALWRLPDPAAVPALLELLRDNDASARQWGVLALGVIHDRRATEPLVGLLSDPESDVRLDSIRSLGRLSDPRAARPLEALVRDDARESAERLEAIDALALLDGPENVNTLVRLIRHEDESLRERAIVALGRVGDLLAIPALRERRAAERNRGVRRAIDGAIESIEERQASGSTPSGGVPLNLPD